MSIITQIFHFSVASINFSFINSFLIRKYPSILNMILVNRKDLIYLITKNNYLDRKMNKICVKKIYQLTESINITKIL